MCVEHNRLRQIIAMIMGQDGDSADDVVGRITYIVCQNVARGRLQTFLDGGRDRSLEEYIRHVVGNYYQQQARVEGLQVEQDSALWELFYQEVRDWVYDYLISRGFMPNEGTFRLVQDYRSCAVEQLLLAHFPYDTEFERWARTVVQNVCRKQIDKAMGLKHVSDRQLVGLEQWLPGAVYRSHEEQLVTLEISDELQAALRELPANFRVVIQFRYIAGMEYDEIAAAMKRSIRAVYNLHFKAIKRLREILMANGYNTQYGNKQSIRPHPRRPGSPPRPTDPEGEA